MAPDAHVVELQGHGALSPPLYTTTTPVGDSSYRIGGARTSPAEKTYSRFAREEEWGGRILPRFSGIMVRPPDI